MRGIIYATRIRSHPPLSAPSVSSLRWGGGGEDVEKLGERWLNCDGRVTDVEERGKYRVMKFADTYDTRKDIKQSEGR